MNYFGEAAGNERSGGSSSSSSSRKGKKSNSDKPKQPQRGLGVAQLEKIRLHSQMGILPSPPPPYSTTNLSPQEDICRIQTAYSSSSTLSYTSPSISSYNTLQGHQNIMMGMGPERSNIMHGEPQLSSNPRWNASNAMLGAQHYAQPGITRHLFNLEVEDSLRKKKRKDQSDSMGSSSQNSDSNGSQELDLELRLSL